MNPLYALVALATFTAEPDFGKVPVPKVNDDRLEIVLFATEPQITTPTGIAVDDQGVVYVIENNTHFRPKEYDRPELDRILRMQDNNGDGRADKVDEFYTGLRNTMSLAFETDGSLLVATRNEVFRLQDNNQDGKAETRTDLIKLDTKGNYPHNGLAGFALDFAGNIYFGFGENLGAEYTISGTDGTTLRGGGEGGNIYSCDRDGKKLRQVATGFWNPFHVTFDTYGRLFTVDNDPDSRPPCRLLHVVEGGDYGFRFRNGRKGVSPFTAWNGELPATLPMVAGTGEAPCAVMAYESDNLPAEYRGELLVTSWGDHRLERYTLKPRGASFSAEMKPVVTGDQNFRPVGLALAPDGSLFMSDWVDKSYPIHGKGRIWHLRAKSPAKREPLSDDPALALAHPHRPWREAAARKITADQATDLKDEKYSERVRSLAEERLCELRNQNATLKTHRAHEPGIREMDIEHDPWLQLAAYQAERNGNPARLTELYPDESSPLAVWQAAELQRVDDPATRPLITKLLNSNYPDLRFLGIRWAMESNLKEHAPAIEKLLTRETDNRRNFEAALVALDRLTGRNHENTGEYFAAKLVISPQAPAATRLMALRMVSPFHADLKLPLLIELTKHEDKALQFEAVRTLRLRGEEGQPRLREIVADELASEKLRCEAILGLDPINASDRAQLLKFANDTRHGQLAQEALRTLTGVELSKPEQASLPKASANKPLVGRVLDPKQLFPIPDAKDQAGWAKLTADEGDAEAGERLFFHPRVASCYKCHEYRGRGGRVGPDLSTVAKSMTRERLLQSIVDPSREIAPQFTPWIIQAADGTVKNGVYVGEEVDGTVRYADGAGDIFKLHPRDVEDRKPAEKSIMPEGLAAQLTPQELRDLLTFLLQK
jgi:putative membrane-bound dehydrogenase-like protein